MSNHQETDALCARLEPADQELFYAGPSDTIGRDVVVNVFAKAGVTPKRGIRRSKGGELLARDAAVVVCESCSRIEACKQDAMRMEGASKASRRHGVWGGSTPEERAEEYRAAQKRRRSNENRAGRTSVARP